MDITQIITEYGPLGFGWIAAIFLYRENKALNSSIREIAENGIKVKMALSANIKEMSDTIKRGFGDA